ncbi:unnamed protein product [Didymodactylos carnosus]|uniref:TLDc domain-containing protein n=1 Tax=Didymodactylos carnosus TaxID=1234261 RepID=A0A8S2HHQ6_9BILA|nr:unnamed protein product [Didymodactylos carnosus]CAF3644769.1 unnamed protein product [Didymodactylos carnosus]
MDAAFIKRAVENDKPIPSAALTIHKQLFMEGTLLDNKQHQLKLSEFSGYPHQRWDLIYKGTRDGFDAKDFHRQCDGRSPTMTVLQSKQDGYLFGGYTAVAWSSTEGIKNDQNAFLFTLTSPHNQPITKLPLMSKDNPRAVYHAKDYGPISGMLRSTIAYPPKSS